jgi:hypothetical protein
VSNLLFANGKHNYSVKNISSTADTLKATLLSMSTAAGKITLVSTISSATPMVVTTTTTHGYTTGDIVVIGGITTGMTCANGTWQVGTTTGTTFQLLTRWDGLNSTQNAAYTSGGWCIDISTAAVLADVSGNSVGTDVTIPGVTDVGGIVNASNWTWTNLPATQVWAIAIYDSTASNDLIAFIDGRYQIYVITQTASTATSIPVAGMGQPRLSATLFGTSVVAFSDGTTATMTAGNAIGDTSITVSSTAATIHRQHQADVYTTPVAFPITPAAGGNLQMTVDTNQFKLFSL